MEVPVLLALLGVFGLLLGSWEVLSICNYQHKPSFSPPLMIRFHFILEAFSLAESMASCNEARIN